MVVPLSEVAWTDADAASEATDLAVVPVGSTEQHGPHAPMGTDAMVAAAVAEAGADAFEDRGGRPVVLAPTVPVGVSEEHRQFTGTLWVPEDAFRAYVHGVVESLADHGFDRVVVVNGHGGNVDALRETCARITREETAYAVAFTWFDAVDLAEVVPDLALGHGGAVETSVVAHLAADLVSEDRFEAAAAGAGERFGEWVAGTNLAYDFATFAEAGNVGDPSAASAAAGEGLLEAAADRLADLLAAVAERDPEPPAHR